eukprot:11203144-Heterocapsa_arctica.AAC.1
MPGSPTSSPRKQGIEEIVDIKGLVEEPVRTRTADTMGHQEAASSKRRSRSCRRISPTWSSAME